MAASQALAARRVVIPTDYFLPLHLVLEFTSIVVCFAVFATAWFAYKRNGSARDLVIGVTFLAAGSADFIHTLTYSGMPSFLGLNGVGEAAAFWLLGRLLVGLGLLAAAWLSPGTRSVWLSPWTLLPAAAAVVVAPMALVARYPQAGELFFSEAAGGLTLLKIGLEYIITIIYAAVFLSLSSRRGWDPLEIVRLRAAMILAVFAELAFTLYKEPYGVINVVGHIYKTAAHYVILTALFVTALQRPYEQLSRALERLQVLYNDAREHRREIEQSFARIGSALSAGLKMDEALDRIAELAADMLHADCAVVVAEDRTAETRRVVAQKGECHDEHRPLELALRTSERAKHERRSVVVDNLQDSGLVVCDFNDPRCLRSMLCSPMIHGDRALGCVTIYSHTPDAFEEGDVKLLEAFAAHAAVAVHNSISYERESRIANVLQKSFLSPFVVTTERFEIAQVYEPAMDEALVGGDFYDVIEMADGRIGLVIGDVSGKGLRAAVHTAMAKYALRAYVHEGRSPAEAIRLLNALVAQADDDTFITMFFGVLDPETSDMVYVNAGHEAPLYACNGAYLSLPSTGPALGFGLELGYREERVELEKGCVLLLYTDGISEARRGTALLGEEGLGKQLLVCEEMGSPDVARCVHRTAVEFAGGELRDDAAILAVRRLR